MIDDFLKARFDEYAPKDEIEQENMLKETMQHYILASLSKHGLFSEAIFHGGTCLRIINHMQRFLPLAEQNALRNWNKAMFLYHLEYLQNQIR